MSVLSQHMNRSMIETTDKREKILEAARTLFTEKAYEDVSVAEIVRRAGVAQGTFYRYFSSKTQLVGSLNDMINFEMQQAFKKVLEENPSEPLCSTIESIIRTTYAQVMDYGKLLRLLRLQMTLFGETDEAVARQEPFLQLMEQLIRKNQEQGWLDTSYDPFILARLINSSFSQFVLDCLIYHPEIDQEGYIAQTIMFVRRALTVPPECS